MTPIELAEARLEATQGIGKRSGFGMWETANFGFKDLAAQYNQDISSTFDKAKQQIMQMDAGYKRAAANPGLAAEMSGMYSAAGASRATPTATAAGLRTAGLAAEKEAIDATTNVGLTRSGRIAANKGSGVGKKAWGMMGAGYRGINAVTKATMGVSAGKLGAGIALGVGALGALDYAIGRDPFSDAGSAVGGMQRFYGAMKEASRPSYGASALQQSTQGLVFGLHNARTAY